MSAFALRTAPSPFFMLLALACVALGGLLLYLASPNQRGLAAPLPATPARWAGCVLLASSLLAFLQGMRPAAAVFAFITALMLVCTMWPYAGAWIALMRKPSR